MVFDISKTPPSRNEIQSELSFYKQKMKDLLIKMNKTSAMLAFFILTGIFKASDVIDFSALPDISAYVSWSSILMGLIVGWSYILYAQIKEYSYNDLHAGRFDYTTPDYAVYVSDWVVIPKVKEYVDQVSEMGRVLTYGEFYGLQNFKENFKNKSKINKAFKNIYNRECESIDPVFRA